MIAQWQNTFIEKNNAGFVNVVTESRPKPVTSIVSGKFALQNFPEVKLLYTSKKVKCFSISAG
jgi:hypothetical protein